MAENLSIGIRECAKCDYFVRCEECAYNKKDIDTLVEEVRRETVQEILAELAKEYDDYGEKRFSDYESFINFAKQHGVEVNNENPI